MQGLRALTSYQDYVLGWMIRVSLTSARRAVQSPFEATEYCILLLSHLTCCGPGLWTKCLAVPAALLLIDWGWLVT